MEKHALGEQFNFIKFEKVIKQTEILSPLKNFEEDTVNFECRTDASTIRMRVLGLADELTKIFRFYEKGYISFADVGVLPNLL